VVSVSPSAGAWLRAGSVPSPDGDTVLVRGPGLASGGAEVPLLAGAYPRRTVLEDGAATSAAVLKALDGSALAHVAAHGTFRSDNPMFSALRMDDGPLTVYDLERLHRAPYRLVLPCCDSGRLEHVGADELLGLASAVLPLGTAGIVAALVPVNDAAVIPLMLAFHDGLRTGRSMAEALLAARRSLPPDTLHQATGASFTVIGAG
jgi:CHAT domain-containing protein